MKNYSQEQVLSAITKSNGIISNVAATLRCSWHTARDYIDKWPDTRQAYERENSQFVATAIRSFFKAVEAGERWAVERVLDTMGRRDGLGLVHRAAVDHTSDGERVEGVAIRFIDTDGKERPLLTGAGMPSQDG